MIFYSTVILLQYYTAVRRFTLGYICYGDSYAEMSVVSLYSLYKSINKDFVFSEIIEEIMIVTDEPKSLFVAFAKSIHSNVRVIEPSNWDDLNLPTYSGNYAVYFKFDLLFNLSLNKSLIYLDSDAFVIGNFDLDFINNRINEFQDKDSLLMVPSHRPVLEKTGFVNTISPYNYYNAGFMIVTLRKLITMDQLLKHRSDYYPKSYEALFWGEQDLINSYFQHCIEQLPFRYNVSTGMIKRENFGPNNLNYLVLNEFNNAVVAHASGSILQSKKYYPYRKSILNIAYNGLSDEECAEVAKISFKKFISSISLFDRSKINSLRQFLGWTPECQPHLYKEGLYWKHAIKKFLKRF